MKFDLSIIIVTYNCEKYIEKCILSIINNTKGLEYEIIVVDNNSSDKTSNIVKTLKSKYENINLIMSDNLGFNHGNNVGIKNSESKYIALLNPDTIMVNNAFKIIIDGLNSDKKIGIGGANLLKEDLSHNVSYGVFPNFINTLLLILKIKRGFTANEKVKKQFVDYPIGACFVFNRELINKIGYLDEQYFLYFDETDYALSISKLNKKACLFTESKIIHMQGKSTESISDFAKTKFMESYIKYLKKNQTKTEALATLYIRITEFKVKLFLAKLFFNNKVDKMVDECKFYKNTLKLFLEK